MQALRHSKVKLTWDDDDPERNRITRRTLSQKEIDEVDFKAYIASSGSESESDASHTSQPTTGDDRKKSRRDRVRAILLSGNDENLPEGWGGTGKDKAGEMEITFIPALSATTTTSHSNAKGEGKTGTGAQEETTLERYQRKERVKKKTKKATREAVRAEGPLGDKKAEGKAKEEGDAFFAIADSNEDRFDDPPKGMKGKNKDPTTAERGEAATEAELTLLLDTPTGVKHFDMAEIMKAERQAEKGNRKKKGKKRKQSVVDDSKDKQDDFEIDTHDPRFKVLLEDHNFGVDPSNPQYVGLYFLTLILTDGPH
jgi:NUC153 domain